MSKKEFDDFLLREKENKEKKPNIDLEAEKEWWLGMLNRLYTDIKSWLNEYTESKKIIIELNEIDIYEEAIGRYSVQLMEIKIFGKIVTLTPVGTILIGTKGRVDMAGDEGTIRLILTDKKANGLKITAKEQTFSELKKTKETLQKNKIEWVWKITTQPPNIKYTDLTQDTFLECLIKVCNG